MNPYGRNLLRNGRGDAPQEKQGCFATSCLTCTKQQDIDFVSEGILPVIMDTVRPDIEVSEWYAGRYDCGGKYELTVSLLGGQQEVLHVYKTGWIETELGHGSKWNQVRHVFRDYPAGVRFVQFKHSGRDTQYWAGRYGPKMAGGVVRIRIQKQIAAC